MKSTSLFLYSLICLVILLVACEREKPTLISWSKEFVNIDGIEYEDQYFHNYKKFAAPYFSKETNGDTLTITALKHEHCVDETIALIECPYNILYLKTRTISTSEQFCPEFYVYTYVIDNPGQVEYKIVSVK